MNTFLSPIFYGCMFLWFLLVCLLVLVWWPPPPNISSVWFMQLLDLCFLYFWSFKCADIAAPLSCCLCYFKLSLLAKPSLLALCELVSLHLIPFYFLIRLSFWIFLLDSYSASSRAFISLNLSFIILSTILRFTRWCAAAKAFESRCIFYEPETSLEWCPEDDRAYPPTWKSVDSPSGEKCFMNADLSI